MKQPEIHEILSLLWKAMDIWSKGFRTPWHDDAAIEALRSAERLLRDHKTA